MGSADADGVEPATVAQGDLACCVDTVAADAVVGVDLAAARGGFGSAGVDGGRGGSMFEGPVRPLLVVGGGEPVRQRLQFGDRGGLVWLGGQLFLHRLLKAFDLAAGGGVVGSGVLLGDAQALEFCL